MTPRLPAIALMLLAAGCAGLDPRPDLDAASMAAHDRGAPGLDLLSEQELDNAVKNTLAPGLTADAAARIAVINNRRARATYEEIGIARADLVRAGLLTNPVFDFSIRFIEGGAGEVIDMGLTQRLTELLTIPTRRAVAETDLELARARAVSAALDAAFAARRAVIDLQAAQRRERALRDAVEARRLAYEFMRALREAGNITAPALTTRRMAYEQSRLELARAELETVEARESVNRALGLWGADLGWTLTEDLPDAPPLASAPADLQACALHASMALEQSRLRLQRAARLAGGAAASVLADDLAAGVGAERDDGRWEIGPSFSIPIPIFDTGAAGRAGAEAQMRRDRELYADQAIAVRAAARLAAVQLEAAAAEESHWRTVLLPLADRALSETLLEYNAMQAGAPDLLDTRAQLAYAQASHAEALARFWRAALRVEALLAGASDAAADPPHAPVTTIDAPSGGH